MAMGYTAPDAPITGGTTPDKREIAGADSVRPLWVSKTEVQMVADYGEAL